MSTIASGPMGSVRTVSRYWSDGQLDLHHIAGYSQVSSRRAPRSPAKGEKSHLVFPNVAMVLTSHELESVIFALRRIQTSFGFTGVEIS